MSMIETLELKSEKKFDESNRKPELLCIGAQKAGTSWVHEVLSQHPDIWVPPFKELHFFDHKFTPNNNRWTSWHIDKSVGAVRKDYILNNAELDRNYLLYLECIQTRPLFNGNWYKGIFSAAPESMTALDVTPEYSCISEEGVDFVAKFLPKAKFIYVIRDPNSRAISQLRMQVENRKFMPSTDTEWEEFMEIAEVFTRADYVSYVPRWDSVFSDRVLYLPFGRIKSDPKSFCREIEEFAGLTHFDYNYREPIHGTDKKITFPDYVLLRFEAEFKVQYEFLSERFGDEFCGEIL